ncbi:TIM barrel protein [candidate division KSB1 bacterium]|nr:TIM barrel protein [candidate division KSB1 bacterium]
MNVSRRDFLKGVAATGAVVSVNAFATKVSAETDLPIGIQLYTVRDKSGKDFKGTLKKVAEIGYKYFEFAGYGGLDAGELNAFLAEIGATTCGSHEGYGNFIKDIDSVIEFNQAIGNPYITIPSMPGHVRSSIDEIKRFADNLNIIGYKVKQAGMQLCYHNHSFEFDKVDGEQTVWDVLFQATDADMVKAEMDVAWVFAADVDPLTLMQQWGDRIKLLHMKDLDANRKLAPVGEGLIDMPQVVEKAKEIGVEWYIVEQDNTRPGKDILDEIAVSYKNMVKLLS